MKRSTFFRSMALGTVGLGLQNSFAAVPFSQGISVWQWLAHLRSALFGKHRTSARFSPDVLNSQVSIQNAFLEKHGFKSGYSPLCFVGEGETFGFFPVVKRFNATESTEMLVPVFFRNNDGAWSHQKTLNGFQLEALCRAADALSARTEPLYTLLMPFTNKEVACSQNTFHTLEGSVTITSKLSDGNVQTRCTVKGREGLLFEESFTSRHNLS